MFINKFEEAAYKERLFFNNLINLYKLFPIEDWLITETPYTGNDSYDFLVQHKQTYKLFIIEIKIRKTAFSDGYFYETNKHKSLSQIKNINPDYNTILYINSTPDGTYIWNIDNIIDKYKPIKKEMNIATMTSYEKEQKGAYQLLITDAKHYPYHWDDKQFVPKVEINNINNVKIQNKLKEDRCILRKLTRQQ